MMKNKDEGIIQNIRVDYLEQKKKQNTYQLIQC